ncbi:MAG: hypothetical protein R3D45_14255 [Rhizobiaceae bacterium]
MRFSSRLLALPLAAAAFFAAASVADAHQRVYADAYGNLIVISPSGYKQIIVGKGHLADELRAEIGEPEIIYHGHHHGYVERSPARGTSRMHRTDAASCIPYGVVLKGRAFMYGVNRGEAVYVNKYCR